MSCILSDFVAGGYFITRYVKRPEFVSPGLLPEKIVSLSSCICPFIPDCWAIEWTTTDNDSRLKAAKKFELTQDTFKDLTQWVTSRFDKEIGWPNVCYSLETAQTLKHQFLSDLSESTILGIGLHKSYVERFKNFTAPAETKPGYAPEGENGVRFCIKKGDHLKEGNVLGFEPIVTHEVTKTLEDSWLCNSLESEVNSELGISLNRNGFIDKFDNATKAVEYIARDKVGAEPGLWLPWMIVQY